MTRECIIPEKAKIMKIMLLWVEHRHQNKVCCEFAIGCGFDHHNCLLLMPKEEGVQHFDWLQVCKV